MELLVIAALAFIAFFSHSDNACLHKHWAEKAMPIYDARTEVLVNDW